MLPERSSDTQASDEVEAWPILQKLMRVNWISLVDNVDDRWRIGCLMAHEYVTRLFADIIECESIEDVRNDTEQYAELHCGRPYTQAGDDLFSDVPRY